MKKFVQTLAAALCMSITYTGAALADDKQYEVTITNLTRGIVFTPVFVSTHKYQNRMFKLGETASPALAALAEGGDASGLPAVLESYDYASTDFIGPGQSASVIVSASGKNRFLSVASMMLPTNDGFIALNGVRLPKGKRASLLMSPGYDAGSEPNDELCAHIPGPPPCGGEALSEGGGEDYVHVHAGIHGIGDLDPADNDWRNPVARIMIKRMNDD